jgi:2-aminoadipate transaminase
MPARAQRMQLVKPNAIGELLRQGADPSIISFAGGYPDAASFPVHALQETYATVLKETAGTALQYTVSDGPEKLRGQIAQRMQARGFTCASSDILVLNGSQQGLDLVGKMLLDPGDGVVTESPTFLGAMVAFNPYQPVYHGVHMDDEGMDVAHLEEVLKSNRRIKLIYTIPDFQNPTGVTLSAPRRKRLVELANAHDVIVLEDTAYRDLRFEGVQPPTIKSFDTQGRVIMLGSFSKILAPGLRLGWAVAAPSLLHDLGLLKLAADTQSGTMSMAAASLFMERHDIDQHIGLLQQVYARKKRVMLDAIRTHFPQEVTFTDPQGGLFTWLSFPAAIDTARFMKEHALPKARVAYVPGATFFPNAQSHHLARFNYSGQSDDRIAEGIAQLGAVLKQELSR